MAPMVELTKRVVVVTDSILLKVLSGRSNLDCSKCRACCCICRRYTSLMKAFDRAYGLLLKAGQVAVLAGDILVNEQSALRVMIQIGRVVTTASDVLDSR